MEKWYALYTNPRAEKKVAAALEAHGFEHYLPLQTTLKQWSDRKKKVQEPLFKSYVFIRTELQKHYYTVLGLAGVVKFVRIGAEITPVRDEVISAIKLSLLHFSEVELAPAHFALNQEVLVIAGPLRGTTGHIAGSPSNQYFAIAIEQLGTSLLVKVPATHLEPLL